MADSAARRYRLYPWPWVQPSILTSTAEDERYWANYWLDADLGEGDDSSDLDHVPSEGSSSDSDTSSDDSMVDSASDDAISESELADITTGTAATWRRPPSPTPSEKALSDQEDLASQVAELVKAEQAAAATYDPDEVVSLITQLYELFITMGHWPEGCVRYPPHTDPPVNEDLAVQLGYAPACIALMHRLPYVNSDENWDDRRQIVARSHFANYTSDEDLKEGRRGLTYTWIDGGLDYDPWLLPIVISGREGTHVMLDTALGTVRAYRSEPGPPKNTVEWRRHGEVGTTEEEQNRALCTEYRRAPLVPAAHYFSEVLFAYRSLLRLPIIDPDRSDPKEEPQYHPSFFRYMITEHREEKETLLNLYRACGWPDQWRRAEFVEKWTAAKKEIRARARQAQEQEEDEDDDEFNEQLSERSD